MSVTGVLPSLAFYRRPEDDRVRRALYGPSMAPSERLPVLQIDLDRPADGAFAADFDKALAVIMLGREALGRVVISREEALDRQLLLAGVEEALGGAFRDRLLSRGVTCALRTPPRAADPPLRTSVVVAAGRRPDRLPTCLDSLLTLNASPCDVVVVDLRPDDRRTRRTCERYGLRRVAWPRGARYLKGSEKDLSGGADVVAFTREACTFEQDWLDDIDRTFHDPLVMAATGFVGPARLDSPAQRLLERDGGFERPRTRLVIDGASSLAPVCAATAMGSWGNAFFRPTILGEMGPPLDAEGEGRSSLAELYCFYRVLEAGFRVAYEPGRVAWHDHPLDGEEARRALATSRGSLRSLGLLCLARHREPDALKLLGGSLAERGLRNVESWASAAARARRVPRRGRPSLLPAAKQAIEESGEAGPPVSVVVPSFNRCDSLSMVLDALEDQTYPADRLEVVVVLDGCTDGSAAMTRARHPRHRLEVVEQANRGLAAARNAGARAATGALLVFVDDDVVPHPAFIAAHAESHRSGDPRRVVLGECVSGLSDERFWTLRQRTWWDDHFRRKAEPDHPWTSLDYSGGNSSIWREWFFAAGGFDEQFMRRNEEQEFGFRLVELGTSFRYCGQARAVHYFQTGFAQALEMHRLQAANDILLAQRHPTLASRVNVAAYVGGKGEVARRVSSVYRHAERLVPFVGPALRLLGALERMRLRGPYRVLAGGLMGHAYVSGMKDGLRSRAELSRFAGAAAAAALSPVVDVELSEREGVKLPTCFDNFCVRLTWHGAALGQVPAIAPGRDWDWDELGERLTNASLSAAEQMVSLDDLLESGGPDGGHGP